MWKSPLNPSCSAKRGEEASPCPWCSVGPGSFRWRDLKIIKLTSKFSKANWERIILGGNQRCRRTAPWCDLCMLLQRVMNQMLFSLLVIVCNRYWSQQPGWALITLSDWLRTSLEIWPWDIWPDTSGTPGAEQLWQRGAFDGNHNAGWFLQQQSVSGLTRSILCVCVDAKHGSSPSVFNGSKCRFLLRSRIILPHQGSYPPHLKGHVENRRAGGIAWEVTKVPRAPSNPIQLISQLLTTNIHYPAPKRINYIHEWI